MYITRELIPKTLRKKITIGISLGATGTVINSIVCQQYLRHLWSGCTNLLFLEITCHYRSLCKLDMKYFFSFSEYITGGCNYHKMQTSMIFRGGLLDTKIQPEAFLFFQTVPTNVRLKFFLRFSISLKLVIQLSVETFFPVPLMGSHFLCATASGKLFC